MKVSSIHQNQPIRIAGEPLANAQSAMILLHGRGATAESILTLTSELAVPGITYLAPQAVGNTWYPNRFLAPTESNQPWLSSALNVISDLYLGLTQTDLSPERIFLLGFSQGACLALEYAARNPRKYGGIIGLSGGLIGPTVSTQDYTGDLENTPVFLGCSDNDFHIPKERVIESASIFEKLGGQVTCTLYPNLGHTINQDEIQMINKILNVV